MYHPNFRTAKPTYDELRAIVDDDPSRVQYVSARISLVEVDKEGTRIQEWNTTQLEFDPSDRRVMDIGMQDIPGAIKAMWPDNDPLLKYATDRSPSDNAWNTWHQGYEIDKRFGLQAWSLVGDVMVARMQGRHMSQREVDQAEITLVEATAATSAHAEYARQVLHDYENMPSPGLIQRGLREVGQAINPVPILEDAYEFLTIAVPDGVRDLWGQKDLMKSLIPGNLYTIMDPRNSLSFQDRFALAQIQGITFGAPAIAITNALT